MVWVRKLFVHFLSLVLFLSLTIGALGISIVITLSHPTKLENWLKQSNLYARFISTAINQAESSTEGSGLESGVSLNDAAVQQAAETAFPPELIEQDVNVVINSNYAWLEGRTKTPNFSIDLSPAKQNFAQMVGKYVQARLSNLPICTSSQAIAQLDALDPLNLTCRPAILNPTTVGSQVTQQLVNGSAFLSNPIITPSSIGSNHRTAPYYQKVSFAPRIYQLVMRAPWELGIVAVLSILGIVFMARDRRRGWRRVGVVFLAAGFIVVAVTSTIATVCTKIENRLLNQANIGQLQQALTRFIHIVQTQLTRIDLVLGISFVVVAVIIGITLLLTSKGKPHHTPPDRQVGNKGSERPVSTNQTARPSPPKPADSDAAPSSKPKLPLIQ